MMPYQSPPPKILYPLRFPFLLCFLYLAFFPGCPTSPVIKMPQTIPDIVKEYKLVKIYAFNTGLVNTGIYVNKGDYFTIMANGEIQYRYSPTSNLSVEPEALLYWRQREEPSSHPYAGSNNNLKARGSGIIFLSILPLPAAFGSFVDIIIWKKEDPILIANFFNDLVSKDPPE